MGLLLISEGSLAFAGMVIIRPAEETLNFSVGKKGIFLMFVRGRLVLRGTFSLVIRGSKGNCRRKKLLS